MSALPPKADIVQHGGNVRFVPHNELWRNTSIFSAPRFPISSLKQPELPRRFPAKTQNKLRRATQPIEAIISGIRHRNFLSTIRNPSDERIIPRPKLDQSVNHPHKQFDGRTKTVPLLKRGTHLVDAQMGLNNETGF
jgi:hypothetical protein